MFKRYLYTFFSLFFLLVLYGLTLLPVLAVRPSLETNNYVLALLIWALLAALLLPPALAMILKRVWFFRGHGEPVVLELLQEILLRVNEYDTPVNVRRQGRKMVVGWRFKEPHWGERMEKNDLTRLYELWLSFDNNTKTVTLTDRSRSVNWDLSPITVRTGWLTPARPYFRVELGPEWGVENYEDTAPGDYAYGRSEIKSPILNTILKSGWNARFSLL